MLKFFAAAAFVALVLIGGCVEATAQVFTNQAQWNQRPTEDGELPDTYEFEQSNDASTWFPIVPHVAPYPCPTCFQATFDTTEPGVYLRSRGTITGGVTSPWSDATVSPEPGLGITLGVLVLALIFRARTR